MSMIQGDITESRTEAIVNAANSSLLGGGGVDGAIHSKGGPTILFECKQIRETRWRNGLPPGQAVITSGGNLPAKYVIHTVGPVWHGGNRGESDLLADCYRNSLSLAKSKGISSIAFPSISTGAFGYPIGQASVTALRTTYEYLSQENGFSLVEFVLFTESDLAVYEQMASSLLRHQT